jgi:tRNA U34 2-thiouridine synthase MnmA/TrmU
MSHEKGGLGSTEAEIASGYQALKKLSSFLKEFNIKNGTKLYRADTYQVFNSVEIKNGKYAGQNLMKLLEGHANGTNPIDLDELAFALKQQGIKQESFLSTSIIKQGADECEREERSIIWEFTTQGRTNGAYIDLYAQTLSNEYECLIDQGSKITIQGFEFDEKQRAVTVGQYVVLYDNENCLGGGTIDVVLKNT